MPTRVQPGKRPGSTHLGKSTSNEPNGGQTEPEEAGGPHRCSYRHGRPYGAPRPLRSTSFLADRPLPAWRIAPMEGGLRWGAPDVSTRRGARSSVCGEAWRLMPRSRARRGRYVEQTESPTNRCYNRTRSRTAFQERHAEDGRRGENGRSGGRRARLYSPFGTAYASRLAARTRHGVGGEPASNKRDVSETALLSEEALAGDVSREEEDKAWKHLQPAQSFSRRCSRSPLVSVVGRVSPNAPAVAWASASRGDYRAPFLFCSAGLLGGGPGGPTRRAAASDAAHP